MKDHSSLQLGLTLLLMPKRQHPIDSICRSQLLALSKALEDPSKRLDLSTILDLSNQDLMTLDEFIRTHLSSDA